MIMVLSRAYQSYTVKTRSSPVADDIFQVREEDRYHEMGFYDSRNQRVFDKSVPETKPGEKIRSLVRRQGKVGRCHGYAYIGLYV